MTDRDGVDVASFQGNPGDWRTAAGDIGFAAIKLTELGADGSRYVSPTAAADWAWLKSAGKKRIAYLFAHPASSGAETAAFFTGEVRSLGLADDDMVAVDLEVSDGLGPARVAAWTRDVLSLLAHDLDRIPVLYTFISFAQAGNCEGCGGYPLWIAATSYPAGEPPQVPPWTRWAIHQYSQEQPIDRDITAYASAAAMARALGKPGMHAAPPKPRKKVVKKAVTRVKKVVKKEPVLTAGSLAAAVSGLLAALQASKGIHLTSTEMRAVLDLVVALAGLCATAAAKPRTVMSVVTALATGATASAGTLLHMTPTMTGAQIPAAALVIALLTRMHVSPAAAEPPA